MTNIGLLAEGPAEEPTVPKDELMLYGQFVGDWDFDCEYYNESGVTERASGEWHFAWALEGRAIVDLWTYPRLSERTRTGEGPGGLGVTVRTYDPKAREWNIAWSDSSGFFLFLRGKRSGDEIVQESLGEGGLIKWWIFSEIAPDSFLWREEVSQDGGQSRRLREVMKCRRAK